MLKKMLAGIKPFACCFGASYKIKQRPDNASRWHEVLQANEGHDLILVY